MEYTFVTIKFSNTEVDDKTLHVRHVQDLKQQDIDKQAGEIFLETHVLC